jgi:uncharacterized protein
MPTERVPVVDVLRGFALLGILLVNMELFARPMQALMLPLEASVSGVDRLADWLVRLLAEGKFYSLFAFLFGWGFAMQLLRAQARSARFGFLYTRRLLVLLAIGVAHALLIWVGDILTLYAVLGLALLLFRQAKPRTLIIWAIILLFLPILFNLFATVAVEVGRQASPQAATQIQRAFAEQRAMYLNDIARAYSVYAHGNFIEITQQRVRDILSFMVIGNLALSPSVLAMFLIGLYFGRRQIFQDIDAHRPFLRQLLGWGLGIGLGGNLVYATLIPSLYRAEPSFTLFFAMLGQSIGAPALCLFYVAALALLYRSHSWLNLLAPLGRLALTNYLGQSVICTLIFYGYGLGWFGQVGKAAGLLMAIAIYLMQALLSTWWVHHFRFGPVEWLWRSLTYLKLQPLRVTDRHAE